ncbi:hypothetical protein D1P53_004565 [Cryptococcus gattii VGV]|nr:hypothetical protein D1P53_004565 [Cryptococcus gattii VGV]
MPRLIPSFSSLPKTQPVQGYKHFVTPLRKLIFDYDAEAPAQHGIRSYIRKPLLEMARQNPDVEIVVRRLKRGKAAVLRGHYVNGRDKVICVNKLEANEVANKASRPPLKFIWSEDQAFEEFDIGSCTWSRVSERNLERVA